MSHAVSPGQPEAARLDAHAASLVALARNAVHPDGGFGWLDPDNHVVAERPVETWIHSRMTHVAALGVLGGDESLRPLLDVGYDGWPTPPARAAAAAGMTVVSGLDMLVHQAAEQFRLFTGHDAPVAEMAAAGRAALARR